MFNPFINPLRIFDFTQPGVDSAKKPTFEEAYRELLERKEGPAMSAYRRFLEEAPPDPNKIKLNTPGKIGAILSGVAEGFHNPGRGAATVTALMNRPYEQALERHTSRDRTLSKAAGIERQVYEDEVQRFKALADLKDKEADNIRQDRLADSLIKQRKATLDNIKDQIEKRGMFHEVDEKTGIMYIIKADGTKTEVGKFNLSTGENITNDKEMAEYRSKLAFNNSSRLQQAGFRQQDKAREDSQQFSRETQINAFDNQQRLLDDRQAHSTSERKARETAQLEYLRQRINLTGKDAKDPSVNQRIKENVWTVDGMVASEPEKYEDIWIVGKDGYKTLNPDKAGTPEYEELRSILYRGFTPKTTASGNERVR